jgi:hypothetical protein
MSSLPSVLTGPPGPVDPLPSPLSLQWMQWLQWFFYLLTADTLSGTILPSLNN